jgi:hypothetical protein
MRCHRPAPDEDDRSIEALEWTPLADADGEVLGVICGDCITPEEQQSMDELDMELSEMPCSRCGRSPHDEDYEPVDDIGDWEVLDDGHLVCPHCITHAEVMALNEETIRALKEQMP